MRVLVTNDDGVEAPGLHALAEAIVGAGHDVYVVAPSGQCSGTGASIGRLHRAGPIECTDVTWPTLPGVPVHALDATPAAAVYAGVLGAFGPAPDVVASGINPGANCGHLVLHSGTVGAALTAAVMGIPAVSVSQAWGAEQHWATAAALVPAALTWVRASDGAPRVCSLNVPNVALAELRGVREATLAPFAEDWRACTRPGEVLLEYVGRVGEPPPGSDVALVHAGYVAVTTLTGITASSVPGAAACLDAALRAYTGRS